MWKTFRLSSEGNLMIATKAWSDFAATIPLIRSFSFGSNFPPEYPIFAGPPIRYHFLFYAAVGMLEKIGFSLPLALNALSIAGFFLLLISIYLFSKKIFKHKLVGILTVLFFLFNGSFSFLEFFKKHPLSAQSVTDIAQNTAFPSFGPYDNKIVSAFWNLNIFTNQRHLALAYAAFFIILYIIHRAGNNPGKLDYKKVVVLGLLVGLFPFLHYAVFGMLIIMLGISFLLYPKIRLKIFILLAISALIALPQILYMGRSDLTIRLFHPGYLIGGLTINSFIRYWFLNLGLVSIIAPVGFFLSDRDQKKILIPFISLFIVGNLFQFSPEIAANHKFFNLFVIGADMFTAYALVRLIKGKAVGKLIVIAVIPFMILSGIIDFFPIINDTYITIEDIPNNKIATFIKETTPRSAVFLNSSFLYNPASLAGRKIYLGWPYFAWSAGYDTDTRGRLIRDFYSSEDKFFICNFLRKENLSYFTVENTQGNRDFPEINLSFYRENFTSVYKSGDFSIYETARNCN